MDKRTKKMIMLGSSTAKAGFANEKVVITKFNNWKKDKDAKEWLKIMGYVVEEIEKVEAIDITGSYKTDVQVKVTIYLKEAIDAQNLSIKLVSNPQGFNQIDKRWVDKYVELWRIPEDVTTILKRFTGEIEPNGKDLRDERRMFFDEMSETDQKKVLDFFDNNKILIITDILKGRDKFAADWMLVALKNSKDDKAWVLKSINETMNHFGNGSIYITDRGSLKIGKITMQRKGGDNGRPTANMLQFKMNPVELFNIWN
jgi:hypothetical protein